MYLACSSKEKVKTYKDKRGNTTSFGIDNYNIILAVKLYDHHEIQNSTNRVEALSLS